MNLSEYALLGSVCVGSGWIKCGLVVMPLTDHNHWMFDLKLRTAHMHLIFQTVMWLWYKFVIKITWCPQASLLVTCLSYSPIQRVPLMDSIGLTVVQKQIILPSSERVQNKSKTRLNDSNYYKPRRVFWALSHMMHDGVTYVIHDGVIAFDTRWWKTN